MRINILEAAALGILLVQETFCGYVKFNLRCRKSTFFADHRRCLRWWLENEECQPPDHINQTKLCEKNSNIFLHHVITLWLHSSHNAAYKDICARTFERYKAVSIVNASIKLDIGCFQNNEGGPIPLEAFVEEPSLIQESIMSEVGGGKDTQEVCPLHRNQWHYKCEQVMLLWCTGE